MNCIYTSVKQFHLKPLLLLAFVFASFSYGWSADGEKLFKTNCSRCHTIGEGKLTGPDLMGVLSRVPSEQWMFNWIKNNKAVLKSGDAYATKIFNENNKQNMDVFDGVLSDDDIKAIIGHIKNPPVAVVEDVKKEKTDEPKEPTFSPFVVLLTLSVLLVFVVGLLGTVRRHLQDSVNAKNGLPPSEPQTIVKWASANKRLVAVIGILCVIILAKLTYEGLMSFSVDQGYQPVQPIKYSHRIHAGKLEIQCVYCHSGAEKGKTAGVPSANVCMNCHKAISKGPETGKVEIAKIYAAVGWDPEKGAYTNPQKPIQWVRVHSLPDFAYFNHSQHVVVGKQECANCHGDMKLLDEAKQNSPLTMGWCVDCHRKTQVPGLGTNPYYEELHAKLKEKYKGKKDAALTVEKIGGLDCIKCHY